MWRIIVICLLAFIFHSIIDVVPVALNISSMPILIGPIVLTFGAFFQKPVEGLVTAILVGLIVDALSGFVLGINMSLFFVLWAGANFLAAWIGQPRWVVLAGFVAVISFAYRVLLIFIAALSNHHWGPLEINPLVVAPLYDAILGTVLMWVLSRTFGILKQVE